ncbi:UNVERIFIED_CONTAM: glycosyltransferase family 4 protein [Spiribacter pallidus]|uniref:glycosyltransferase family 4 protein n=1 Tax=Spiribacter pallidus TaxID=1987936 RepID=UPI00349F36C1
MTTVTLVMPAPIERATGGNAYDRRMAEALPGLGIETRLAAVTGDFPHPGADDQQQLRATLESQVNGAVLVVDGLILGGLPELFAEQANRLRLIGLVHHPLADETGLSHPSAETLRLSEARSLALCKGIIATSAFTARRIKTLGLAHRPVHVAPPGTAPRPLAEGRDGDPTLLCVASLTPRKAQHVLIDALNGMQDQPWHCTLAGEDRLNPAYARRIRRQIETQRLDRRITVTGALDTDRLENAYHRADLFVLPAVYEGYGMVIDEAIARGLPVVSTQGGAIPDTLPPGAGVLVPPHDADALRKTLSQLLRDPATHRQLARGARAARAALTTPDQAAAGFAAALREVLGHD